MKKIWLGFLNAPQKILKIRATFLIILNPLFF